MTHCRLLSVLRKALGAAQCAHIGRIHSCSIASLQSRILLQLALATGMDNNAIRKMFEAEFMENIFEGNWGAAPRVP